MSSDPEADRLESLVNPPGQAEHNQVLLSAIPPKMLALLDQLMIAAPGLPVLSGEELADRPGASRRRADQPGCWPCALCSRIGRWCYILGPDDLNPIARWLDLCWRHSQDVRELARDCWPGDALVLARWEQLNREGRIPPRG